MKWKTAVIFSGIALMAVILYNILYAVISIAGHNMEYENTLAGLKSKLDSGKNIEISDELVNDVAKLNGWIQFVDSNGTEVWNALKPSEIPGKYCIPSRNEIIGKLSDALDCDIISNKAHLFYKKGTVNEKIYCTYYLGIPTSEGIKRLTLERVFSFFYKLDIYGIVTFIIILLIAGLLGYFYARRVLPCRNIVKKIDNLGTKDYRSFDEKGIYKDVYKHINSLAVRVYSEKIDIERSEQTVKKRTIDTVHELKDTIAIIEGYAEILSEIKGRDGDFQEKEYADIILNKSRSLDRMLEDISITHKGRE